MIVTRMPGGEVRIGTPPDDPSRIALLEAAGALLVWDAAGTEEFPHAIVWHPARAAAWAWEIYGSDAAAAVLGEVDAFAPALGPSATVAHRAADAAWAQAWWPASVIAAIPPLDPRLLALERATALADVEHLLDDDAAVDAAVRHALTFDLTMLPESAHDLAHRVREHGEDRGVDVPEPAPRAIAYALAAASGSEPTASAAGTAPIDPSAVPPATVDAAAPARWGIAREGAETILRIRVDRAPRHPADDREPGELHADFAGTRLVLAPDGSGYIGTAVVPASLLLLRPEGRPLTITSPGRAPSGDVDTAALLARAHDRLARGALLAEREAGR